MIDHLEIERKYLIKMPNANVLLSQKGCTCDKIEQTYLTSEKGISARVRKRQSDTKCEYTKTEKRRITPITCEEKERVISADEYTELLKLRQKELRTIEKLRYAFPYKNRVVEIDVYPFWDKVATLEIEMQDENEQIFIPDFVEVICEVSTDSRFKNRALAEEIPEESEFLS